MNSNSFKCDKQRERLENIYIRTKRTPERNCTNFASNSYEFNFTINPDEPCVAVRQLTNEIIRFADSLFVGDECPTQRIFKVREITMYDSLCKKVVNFVKLIKS